ncbi:hypothetical protein [Candidatus Phytoplasma sp. AldY-WA1]|uniref:hypothetical protein n=1 Tax=Candidatus Phytoplasma sp. AldY-WA1 TaxID=2852100 RepID=UPI00254E2DC1|nr:hypothetical protein [Candidatus Phytoplasma sp. AldY-WA1]
MLTCVEKFKQELECKYDTLSVTEQTIFNKIKTVEQRRNEYQKLIDEVEVKQLELINKINVLNMELQAVTTCKLACDDYNRGHAFNFENVKEALFEGFEIYQNTLTAKAFVNVSKNIKMGAKTIAKIAITATEFHRGFNMIKRDYFNDDDTPKMMDKYTYDKTCDICDRAIKKYKKNLMNLQKKLMIFEINKNLSI